MNHLEKDLRDEFARRVAVTPSLPHLTETALRRGRAARRRRRVLVAAAAVGVVAVALSSTSLKPTLPDRSAEVAAAPLEGPPRVPLFVASGPAELLDWPAGALRSRPLADDVQPIAQVPGGILVVIGGAQPALGLLASDADEPRAIAAGLDGPSVAVSADGRRAAIVTVTGYSRLLQEVELPSGRVLRTVVLVPPTFSYAEPVEPVAYSAGAVLVNVGKEDQQRTWLWEGNEDHVVGKIDGARSTVDGADADFSDDRNAIGGRAAWTVRDKACGTVIHELRTTGDRWRLCQERFVAFSPDGETVLAMNPAGNALLIHDADGGDVKRTFDVPQGLRASGWESDDTILYTTTEGPRTVIIRCSVHRAACATAVEFPYNDRIPQPVISRLSEEIDRA
jgi:hypothetical protein